LVQPSFDDKGGSINVGLVRRVGTQKRALYPTLLILQY